MLRITVHKDALCLMFQLEGRLAGRWVQELETCWRRTVATQQKPIVRVDLAGVTFVDAEGQACLVALHQQGAEFVAADCETKSIVDEITSNSLTRDDPSKQSTKAELNDDDMHK